MSDLPVYPLPIGATLHQHDWIELRHQRLLGSRWRAVMTRTPEAGFFGAMLWFEAMRQDPAGTLPDDDDELAMLAGLGPDVERWRELRGDVAGGALYGWVTCLAVGGEEEAERRLMHPTVTEIAERAWGYAQAARRRSEDAVRSKQISRVIDQMRKTALTSRAARNRDVAAKVLDWLQAERLTIRLEHVERALEALAANNVIYGVDFRMK